MIDNNPWGLEFFFEPALNDEVALYCHALEPLGSIGTFLPHDIEFLRRGNFGLTRRSRFFMGTDENGQDLVGLSEVRVFKDSERILKGNRQSDGQVFVEVAISDPNGIVFLEMASKAIDAFQFFENYDEAQKRRVAEEPAKG